MWPLPRLAVDETVYWGSWSFSTTDTDGWGIQMVLVGTWDNVPLRFCPQIWTAYQQGRGRDHWSVYNIWWQEEASDSLCCKGDHLIFEVPPHNKLDPRPPGAVLVLLVCSVWSIWWGRHCCQSFSWRKLPVWFFFLFFNFWRLGFLNMVLWFTID